jgi:hypothetical protein
MFVLDLCSTISVVYITPLTNIKLLNIEMTEAYVLGWQRHKNVAGFNQLIES